MRQKRDPQKVLVIDDDDDVAELICEALRDSGYYSVASARHGAAALELVKQMSPDVILLDLNMPFMDGWSFVSQYRRTGNGARIVLLTGHAHVPEVAQSLGADGFIAKPFAIDDLVMVLAEQLPVS